MTKYRVVRKGNDFRIMRRSILLPFWRWVRRDYLTWAGMGREIVTCESLDAALEYVSSLKPEKVEKKWVIVAELPPLRIILREEE